MEVNAGAEASTQLDQITERLEKHEQRLERLQFTLRAVVRETSDVSISGPCGQCNRCYLLLKNGMMYCPQCGNGGSR